MPSDVIVHALKYVSFVSPSNGTEIPPYLVSDSQLSNLYPRRSRVSISPLSFTVVVTSSNKTTASVSFEYSGNFSCAAARNQSGALSARTTALGRKRHVKTTEKIAIVLVVLGSFGRLENHLGIVIGFGGAEKCPQSR